MIVPSVLESDRQRFRRRLEKLIPLAKRIQIDFMDGQFVKHESINIDMVPDLRKYKDNMFEAHLMVSNPKDFIEGLARKGFKRVLFHYEAHPSEWDIITTMKYIRAEGMEPVLVINPDTDIKKVIPFIHKHDTVMLMGVHPGTERQQLIEEVIDKVRQLRRFSPTLSIQIDGGVNPKTAAKLFEAGADILNSGSFVSESRNPKKAIEQLEKARRKREAADEKNL